MRAEEMSKSLRFVKAMNWEIPYKVQQIHTGQVQRKAYCSPTERACQGTLQSNRKSKWRTVLKRRCKHTMMDIWRLIRKMLIIWCWNEHRTLYSVRLICTGGSADCSDEIHLYRGVTDGVWWTSSVQEGQLTVFRLMKPKRHLASKLPLWGGLEFSML